MLETRSLRDRLLFCVFLACILPYTLSSVYLGKMIMDQVEENYNHQADRLMEQIQVKIGDAILKPAFETVTMLSFDERLKDTMEKTGSQVYRDASRLDVGTYQHIKSFYDSHPNIVGIAYATAEGGYYYYPEYTINPDYDPRQRMWYQEALYHQGQPAVTDPYIQIKDTPDMVVAIVHTVERAGKLLGVVVFGWNVSEFEKEVSNFRFYQNGYAVVLNQNNRFVVSPQHPEWLLKTPEELGLTDLMNLSDRYRATNRVYFDGREQYMRINISPKSGWTVITFVDADQLALQVQQLLHTIMFVYLATMTLLLIAVYIAARQIIGPIHDLAEGAQALAEGKLSMRVISHDQDEIGQLANHFNRMAEKLEGNFYELQRKELEFQTLVENAQDIILRLDRQYRFVYINPIIEQYTGVAASEYLGRRLSDFSFSQEFFVKIKEQEEHLFDQGLDLMLEMECISKNQEIIYFQAHWIPEFGTDGQVTTLLGIMRNMTQQKQVERQMYRMDQLNLVGEMAAGIAHEVRNPLTTVRGFLQMLSRKKAQAAEHEYYLLMIEEIDRANSIITEFLSLAKNKRVSLEIQNLNEIVSALKPLIQADALLDNKVLQVELGNLPDLMLDAKEIRQLLLNLARNGLEAMEKGGTLTIKTYAEQDSVVLAVCDQGKGLDEKILENLGRPFMTTKENGTGLGLAVCYSIVARHHGTLTFDSGPEGTTVFVSLPI